MPEASCIQFTNGSNQFCVKNKVDAAVFCGYLVYLLASALNKTLNILFVGTNLENLTASLWACGLWSWSCWMCASMSIMEKQVVLACSYHLHRWVGSYLFLLLRDVLQWETAVACYATWWSCVVLTVTRRLLLTLNTLNISCIPVHKLYALNSMHD